MVGYNWRGFANGSLLFYLIFIYFPPLPLYLVFSFTFFKPHFLFKQDYEIKLKWIYLLEYQLFSIQSICKKLIINGGCWEIPRWKSSSSSLQQFWACSHGFWRNAAANFCRLKRRIWADGSSRKAGWRRHSLTAFPIKICWCVIFFLCVFCVF